MCWDRSHWQETDHFSLNNILVVLQIKKNLLSISQFMRNYTFYFEFHASSFAIKDSRRHWVLLMKTNHQGLYTYKDSQYVVFFSQKNKVVGELTWHCWLGHPNSVVLQLLRCYNMIPVNKSISNSSTSCLISESTKVLFSLSNTQCSHPLEKIHWDISQLLLCKNFKIMWHLLMTSHVTVGCIHWSKSQVSLRFSSLSRK